MARLLVAASRVPLLVTVAGGHCGRCVASALLAAATGAPAADASANSSSASGACHALSGRRCGPTAVVAAVLRLQEACVS